MAAIVLEEYSATKIGPKLAPFNPTNIDCIYIALQLLNLVSADCLYDLGCGDGRFLVEASKLIPSVSCVGVEFDLDLFNRAKSNCLVFTNVTLIHDNVLNTDISDATAVFVYLVPEGIAAMRPRLLELLAKGARVVTYVFAIQDLTPTKIELYKFSTKLYLYTKDSLTDLS